MSIPIKTRNQLNETDKEQHLDCFFTKKENSKG